jgi:hypothetical protein
VAPGLFVERKEEKNGFTRISADDRTLQVEGWLEAKDLGPVFVPSHLSGHGLGEHWALAQEAKLLDKPGGRTIARMLDTAPQQVIVEEVKRGGSWFVEVAYRAPTLSVTGFVPKSALSPDLGRRSLFSLGSVGFQPEPPAEKLTFPAGACLYAEPWGEVVGVLRRPFVANVHVESGERAAWRSVYVASATQVWLPREGATTTAPDRAAQPLSLAEGFSCAPPPKRQAALP